jgi:hypothetical protein
MKVLVVPVHASEATDIDVALIPAEDLKDLAGRRKAKANDRDLGTVVSHMPHYLVSWEIPENIPEEDYERIEDAVLKAETCLLDINKEWLEDQNEWCAGRRRIDFSRAEIDNKGIFWEFLEKNTTEMAETAHVSWEKMGIAPPGDAVTGVNWSHITHIDQDEMLAEGGPTPEWSARKALRIVLDYWGDQGQTELETATADLIADLMHMARMNGCDIDEMLRKARFHHDMEAKGEK